MLLEHFNNAEPSELMELLIPCIDIARWAQEIIDARPYESLDGLTAQAQAAASPFTEPEIESALAHHPRIGERAAGTSVEATLSRKEQSAVDPADTELAQALAAGNKEYDDKFGHVFLIRAAGKSPQEILASLHQRLNNQPSEEQKIVAQQLREIAVLRLQGAVSA